MAGAETDSDDSSFRVGSRVILGTLLAFLLIAGCGGWAASAQLAGAVIASGSVTVDENLKAIQHRDGGIIGEIAVREGDFVREGAVMLRLDDAQTRAELSIVDAQLLEFSARRARLLAERDGLSSIGIQAEVDSPKPEFGKILQRENRLLESNRQARASQKEQLRLGITQLIEEVKGVQAQRESKTNELGLVREENEKLSGLAEKRLIEGSRVYTSNRELVSLQGELGELDATIARARARMSEIELQIIAIDEVSRIKAQEELNVVEPKLTELTERRVAIRDRLSRTDIRAPLSGTVNELSVHTIGGVISPAETLITMVPEGARLTISAQLAPTDIDQVHLNQTARLRFSAFNQTTTPELFGTVSYVSAATATDKESGQPYYLAHVAVPAEELAKLGDNTMVPGMPVEVYMMTDQRTALSYLARPLVDKFQKAFREQ